jgi:hypothetical protein
MFVAVSQRFLPVPAKLLGLLDYFTNCVRKTLVLYSVKDY